LFSKLDVVKTENGTLKMTLARGPVFDIRIVDVHGQALAGVECDVDSESKTLLSGVTADANGVLHIAVPATKLLFLSVHVSKDELLTMRLDVSGYGGGETVTGARARLNNLGYLALGDEDPIDGPSDDPFTRALDRFRYANRIVDSNDLPIGPTGEPLDDQTKQRLETAHDDSSGNLIDPR
jgi:hypothetical protein